MAGTFDLRAISGAINSSLGVFTTQAVVPPPDPTGFDGPAELPRITPTLDPLFFTYLGGDEHTPQSAAELQTLTTGGTLDGRVLKRGDRVTLAAGVVYTTGSVPQITWPALSGTLSATDPSTWVHVRTASIGSLPVLGRRVANGDKSFMPIFRQQVAGGTPPFRIANNASGYVFTGIAGDAGSVTGVPGGPGTTRVFEIGDANLTDRTQQPSHIVLDRCHVSTAASNFAVRCILLECKWAIVRGCHVWNDPGGVLNDDQAINSLTALGPHLIDNCLLVAGAENIMYGGGGRGVASDITIRRCHFFKPLSWNPRHPSYDGILRTVKNHFEIKKGERVLLEDCVLENMFFTNAQQFAINLKSVNQSEAEPLLAFSRDITVRWIRAKNVLALITVNRQDTTVLTEPAERITVRQIVADGLHSLQLRDGVAPATLRVTVSSARVKNVTCIPGSDADLTASNGLTGDPLNPVASNVRVDDCIIPRMGFGAVRASGTPEGSASLVAMYGQSDNAVGNALVGVTNAALYPAGNTFPANYAAVGFVDLAGGNYALAPSSPLKGTASNGGDPGADAATLTTRTAGCETGVWA